jgi:hypothetical protein
MRKNSLFLALLLTLVACNSNEKKNQSNENPYERVFGLSYDVDTNNLVDILQIGDLFHSKEVMEDAENKEWVGLFFNTEKVYVKETKIKTTRVEDPIVDENGQKTGWKVESLSKDSCYLVFSKSKFLVNNDLVFYRTNKELKPKDIVTFNLEDIDYKIIVTAKNMDKKENEMHVDYAISIVSNQDNLAQKIHFKEGEIDQYAQLLWIGDLDNDKKPDFIFDISNKSNVSEIAVFLSSKAGKGKIVKLFGKQVRVGC